jgi:hypothetical protein
VEELHQRRAADQRDGRRQTRLRRHGRFPRLVQRRGVRNGGKHSLFISVLSGSIKGSGNGIVVPSASSVQSLAELKGKTISVPFASTAHGMLLRAVAAQAGTRRRT